MMARITRNSIYDRDDYVLQKLVESVGVQSGSSRLMQHIGPLQPLSWRRAGDGRGLCVIDTH
jgi:hypothetical protein